MVIQRPLDNEVIKHRKPLTYYTVTTLTATLTYSSVSLGYSLIIDETAREKVRSHNSTISRVMIGQSHLHNIR